MKTKAVGECLFESFEMQVYGKVTEQKIVRMKNVEYLTASATSDSFFTQYIE